MKKYVFTKKRKMALKKARAKWKSSTKKTRKKAMPNPTHGNNKRRTYRRKKR